VGYYRNLESADTGNTPGKQSKGRKKILAFIICFFIAALLWVIIAMDKNYKSKISFYIYTESNNRVKVTADVYGEGFDIMKEKFFSSKSVLKIGSVRKNSLDSEQLLRDSLDLSEGLKYSNFKPAAIELNNTQ
jgi:hypothetical protein